MSLCKTTEVYSKSTEAAAQALIEEAKASSQFTLVKSSTEYKTIKEKKEIVGEYWVVTLVKQFNDPKYPESEVSVEYNIDNGFFPNITEDDE